MCAGIHYGEVEGLVSLERLSCNRGASFVVEYIISYLLLHHMILLDSHPMAACTPGGRFAVGM